MSGSPNAIYSIAHGSDGGANKPRSFLCMVMIAQVLGVSMVAMVGVWLAKYCGGFAWDGTSKEFNVHPLCLVIGMVFLYGEAILSYRVFRNTKKIIVKLLHATLLTLGLILSIVGLVAVFQNHNKSKIANLYSMHSWCGLTTVILFGLQLILGFLCFLFPHTRQRLRSSYLPLHQYFGATILSLAGITCISGINEKLFFQLSDSYQKLPASAVLGNMCGIVIIAFIFSTIFIVQRPEWKRGQEKIDDEDDMRRPFTQQYSSDDES